MRYHNIIMRVLNCDNLLYKYNVNYIAQVDDFMKKQFFFNSSFLCLKIYAAAVFKPPVFYILFHL